MADPAARLGSYAFTRLSAADQLLQVQALMSEQLWSRFLTALTRGATLQGKGEFTAL